MLERTYQEAETSYRSAETDRPAVQQALVQRYYQRQALPARTVLPAGKPAYAPADQQTFLGGWKESPEVRRHNQRLQAMYLVSQRVAYGQDLLTSLEYRGFDRAVTAAGACEKLLLSYDPDSLTFAFGGQLLLDSLERLRAGTTDLAGFAHDAVVGLLR